MAALIDKHANQHVGNIFILSYLHLMTFSYDAQLCDIPDSVTWLSFQNIIYWVNWKSSHIPDDFFRL